MTREVLLAQGWTTNDIRRAVRARELRRLWPSVYTDAPRSEPWVEYALTVRAAGLIGGWGAISHVSAAALWGIPVLAPDTTRVHTTIDGTHGGGLVSARRHVHPRPLPDRDVTVLDGLPVTTRARTAVDVAMSGGYEQALVVIDGVRRAGRFARPSDPPPVGVDELRRIVDALGPRRGRPVVLRAIADSVELSDSAGESWSRARMLQWQLPRPSLQERFLINGRTYFADFRWGSLIGEFDGLNKYASDAERVRYEKRRDGDFATIGMAVCHWQWEDLENRRRFFTLLTGAMARSAVIDAPPPFPG